MPGLHTVMPKQRQQTVHQGVCESGTGLHHAVGFVL